MLHNKFRKYLIFFTILASLYSTDVKANNDMYLSDAELAANLYTNHVPAFKVLFEVFPNAKMLEFGLGKGSFFFIKNCAHVTSLELVVKDSDGAYSRNAAGWYKICKDSFQGYENWDSILHYCGEPLCEASAYAGSQEPDRHWKPIAALDELSEICTRYVKGKNYDLAFVDAGIHNRGELVNTLFKLGIKIIAAHDTNYAANIYGWSRIKKPKNYVRVHYKHGCGTTFWVHKSLSKVIKHLKAKFNG